MKKIISLLIIFALIGASVFALSACSKQNKEKENENKNTSQSDEVGGWTKAGSPVITEDFKKIFEKATAKLDGVDYTPVAYLASQIVSGTNHCVLCKATPVTPNAKTTYAIVYIYEDLQGNAKVSEIVSSKANAENAEEDVVGGWAETETPEMTDEAKTALDKACETLTGAEYKPLALLATQVVAGTNYRIICQSIPSVPSAESSYVIVSVYADLDGNAEITDTIEFQQN